MSTTTRAAYRGGYGCMNDPDLRGRDEQPNKATAGSRTPRQPPSPVAMPSWVAVAVPGTPN
jgi:hypothetical protein